MRLLIVAIVFFSGIQLTAAQTFNYPKLSLQGTDLSELTPKNWKIIDTAMGDLNNDQLPDLALIYESNLPTTEQRAYGSSETEFISEYQKPRILALYFKNSKTNKYNLVTQNNNFILRSEEGGAIKEPLKDLAIAENKLKLFFEGGNDWRWKLNYEFKHEKNDWILVHAVNTYYNNVSGEMVGKDYDFLKRTLALTTGSIYERNAANQTTEEILFFSSLRTFKSFKKPWTWEITKDSYL